MEENQKNEEKLSLSIGGSTMEENQKNKEKQEVSETKSNPQEGSRFLKEGEVKDPEAYLASFPPGYRFKPTDEELINEYLKPKNFGQPLPVNKIEEVELYECSPKELNDKYKAKEMYLFTKRDRKYLRGNVGRVAGNGFWKGCGGEKPIGNEDSPIGYKINRVFYEGTPKNSTKTDWKMDEYKIDQKKNAQSTKGKAQQTLQGWGNEKPIGNKDSPVWYKTNRVFCEETPKDSTKTDWMMHEYKIDPKNAQSTKGKAQQTMQMEGWVLCRVYNKSAEMEENQKNKENKQEVSQEGSGCPKEGDIEDPEAHFASFPPGYRFNPTDEELIIHYLNPKNLGQPLPVNTIKPVILSQKSPEQLYDTYKPKHESVMYFLTIWNQDTVLIRKTSSGEWRSDKTQITIGDGDHPIGYKRRLLFFQGIGNDQRKTNWVMVEYRMHDMKKGSWVLCKIDNKEYDPRQLNLKTESTVAEMSARELQLSKRPCLPRSYAGENSPLPNSPQGVGNPIDPFQVSEEDILFVDSLLVDPDEPTPKE